MWKHVTIIIYVLFIQHFLGQACRNNEYNTNQQIKTSSCLVWGDYHVKTFDDHGISFKSSCGFILTTFKVETSQFTVEVGRTTALYTFIKISYGRAVYKLALDDKQKPVFSVGSQTYSIPHYLDGISIHKLGNRIFVDFVEVGISIRWNAKHTVEISIDNSKEYSVLGLCGNNDKCSSNDVILKNNVPTSILEIFLQEWTTSKDKCSSDIRTESPCTGSSSASATAACQILKDSKKFGQANLIVNPDLYIRACIWNYCSCKLAQPKNCLCEILDVYAKASVSAGVDRVSWRDKETCPVECVGELHFQPCAPKGGVRACGDSGPSQGNEKCEEGCYCFPNHFLFHGKCYLKKNCPCMSQGKVIQAGETIANDCNTCTCTNGKLECTDNPCTTATCHGDPHYTTFDGKKYDFMGRCVYYLVKGSDFSIEADQYGLLNGQFLKNYTEGPSYARGIFIRMAGQFIELKPNLVTEANKIPVTRFPHQAGPLLITKPSNSYITVYLPNNMQVIWNGIWTITVKIPKSMEGKVMGLFGTYTGDQSDDFMTPDGEIVDNPTVFGNSWKTEYSCLSEPLTPIKHPCEINPGAKAEAEKACRIIKSDIFKRCQATDAETDYQNCVYDACYYPHDMAKSYCSSITIFADECGKKGVAVNWRDHVPECKINCPAGLVYQTCSNGCSRSCEDIALRPNCPKVCVEGCNCPVGYTLNEDGRCILIEQCKCRIGSVLYTPGFKYIKNEEELRTCKNARWVVTEPSEEDLRNILTLEQLNAKCTLTENSVYTPCKYPTSKTCQNMLNYEIKSIIRCVEGCQCIDGYVLDTAADRCIKPEECPCYDKGKSYKDGSTIVTGLCTKCTCKSDTWDCNNDDCLLSMCLVEDEVKVLAGGKCICKQERWRCIKPQCDVWDGFHIKTFGGVHYDIYSIGECSYILVQGKLNAIQFNIVISNERCLEGRATCFKSLTINTNTLGVKESITLIKNGKLPNSRRKKSMLLTDYIAFITVGIIGTDIQVFWDKKSWIFVEIEPKWVDNVAGLCGNFYGVKDDALYISDGESYQQKAIDFFNIWKNDCQIKDYINTCDARSIEWAKDQCIVLWSEVFAKCRAKVRVDEYYDACVNDVCKCEGPVNCQRFCSAISAYAHQCNNHGVSVNLRTPDICPIECSATTEYQQCASLCPPTTCEMIQKNITLDCEEAICVEGCAPRSLPKGHAYTDSTYEIVVPSTQC